MVLVEWIMEFRSCVNYLLTRFPIDRSNKQCSVSVISSPADKTADDIIYIEGIGCRKFRQLICLNIKNFASSVDHSILSPFLISLKLLEPQS
jgi:hypothetical protein